MSIHVDWVEEIHRKAPQKSGENPGNPGEECPNPLRDCTGRCHFPWKLVLHQEHNFRMISKKMCVWNHIAVYTAVQSTKYIWHFGAILHPCRRPTPTGIWVVLPIVMCANMPLGRECQQDRWKPHLSHVVREQTTPYAVKGSSEIQGKLNATAKNKSWTALDLLHHNASLMTDQRTNCSTVFGHSSNGIQRRPSGQKAKLRSSAEMMLQLAFDFLSQQSHYQLTKGLHKWYRAYRA